MLPEGGLGFRVQAYGLLKHSDLYSSRQLCALATFAELVDVATRRIEDDASRCTGVDAAGYARGMRVYLALAVSKCADLCSTLCHWMPNATQLTLSPTFMRPTLSMNWDYAEGNPFSDYSGNFLRQFELVAKVIRELPAAGASQISQLDARVARDYPLVISTDPPYYDNIGYADLSDFFYTWLRIMLSQAEPDLFGTMLVPKESEMISDPSRHGDAVKAKHFFECGLSDTFSWARIAESLETPMTVFYAFKQTESGEDSQLSNGQVSTGWEVMLDALIGSGFTVSGTWPLRTERTGRPRSNASNALASSVVLACVPRDSEAATATRREFLNALKRELPDALNKLQSGNIAPVDLAQAAIGPGMAVFSRYGRVVESDGSPMRVRSALMLINQVLDEVLAEQEGEFDGDTRWSVAWFEQHGTQEGQYGVAETLSRAKNTSVQGLVEAGVITARGGKVKLITRDDMPEDWDPATDKRATCWEATQHLIRRLQNEGEEAAAQLLTRLGGEYGEMARDLAYRLYSVCERKGWAQEALAYNSLVIAWSEISKLSRSVSASKPTQSELFE